MTTLKVVQNDSLALHFVRINNKGQNKAKKKEYYMRPSQLLICSLQVALEVIELLIQAWCQLAG